MSTHNITHSVAFHSERDRAVYWLVSAYPSRLRRWVRAVVPSVLGLIAFVVIAACVAAAFA